MIKNVRTILRRWDNLVEDEQEEALEYMRKVMPSDRTLRIDADSLLYYVAYAPKSKEDAIEGGSFEGIPYRESFKEVKNDFLSMVKNLVIKCELESFRGNMPRFCTYELIFTPRNNFRYDIYPAYKKNRKNVEQSNTLKRLKKWAYKNYTVPTDIEADDLVYYYALQGDPVASPDKDVLNSVPVAFNYHPKHNTVMTNTQEERERWVLLQTLAGDPSDDIPGIKGVAIKTADKLLPKKGTFKDVLRIYKEKGLTEEDAILTRRLVGLDQYKQGRVNLWTLNTIKGS